MKSIKKGRNLCYFTLRRFVLTAGFVRVIWQSVGSDGIEGIVRHFFKFYMAFLKGKIILKIKT